MAKLVCGDGSCFDGTGLTVDVERPLTADEQTAYYDYTVENDPQIQRAVSTAQQMSGTTTVSGVNEAASSEAADSAAAESVAEGDAELHLPGALRQRPRPPKVKQQGRALHPVVKNKRTTSPSALTRCHLSRRARSWQFMQSLRFCQKRPLWGSWRAKRD